MLTDRKSDRTAVSQFGPQYIALNLRSSYSYYSALGNVKFQRFGMIDSRLALTLHPLLNCCKLKSLNFRDLELQSSWKVIELDVE